jgi:hypothetical protein
LASTGESGKKRLWKSALRLIFYIIKDLQDKNREDDGEESTGKENDLVRM